MEKEELSERFSEIGEKEKGRIAEEISGIRRRADRKDAVRDLRKAGS